MLDNILRALQISSENEGVATGATWLKSTGVQLHSYSPVDGKLIASVTMADKNSYEALVLKAQEAFAVWRQWPAPKRGDVVRQIAEALRKQKEQIQSL